jgi:hypothetical protein
MEESAIFVEPRHIDLSDFEKPPIKDKGVKTILKRRYSDRSLDSVASNTSQLTGVSKITGISCLSDGSEIVRRNKKFGVKQVEVQIVEEQVEEEDN